MTADYWNRYVAGRTWYARPVREGEERILLVPTHMVDGTPLPPDFLETAGEIGFSMPLVAEDTDSK